MKKELLSITDENSILITAEFLESGEILKVGDRSIRRFELDLIVKNEITCDQLLEAVGAGLRNRLLDKYHFDVRYDDTQLVYTDSREPEMSGELSAGVQQRAGGTLEEKFSFFKQQRIRKNLKILESLQTTQEASDSENDSDADSADKENIDTRTEEDRLRDGYLVCWNVFEECFRAYKEGDQPEQSKLERIKYGTAREPMIGIGSIDYNKIPYGRQLCESDIFKICLKKEQGAMTLKDLGFITTTRLVFDPIGWHHSAALFDGNQVCEAFKSQTPLYNISERPLRKLDDEPIHIIPPTDPPQKGKQNLVTTILTPLLMTGAMIGVRLLVGGSTSNMSIGLMTGCMGIMSAIVALLNLHIRNKEHKESVEEWRRQYQAYVQHLLTDIQDKQIDDIEKLHELYPPARIDQNTAGAAFDLVSKALSVDGDIFSHGQEHPDFLTVRIGTSTDNSELVPSVFEIIGEKKEAVFASVKYHNIKNISGYPFGIYLPEDKVRDPEDGSTGYLIDLPADISKEYAFLKEAPVLLNLRDCGALGIVFDKCCDFQPFLSNLLLNLCFYQSPEDLQCVMFCEENNDWSMQQEIIRRYKHLPHFRELLGNLSAFAFNKEDAYLIFNKLLEILSERKKADGDAKYPHILVIVQEEYEMKRHPVSEYLPSYAQDGEKPDYGISFIFCKRYVEELPKYCGQVIKRNTRSDNQEEWFLLPHTQVITRSSSASSLRDENRYGFVPDALPPLHKDMGNQEENDQYYRAFKAISALYYERIAQGADVPGSVELFDIIGNPESKAREELYEELKQYIFHAWGVKTAEGAPMPSGEQVRNATKSLAVPIGKKAGGVVELDLHERGDGPHMLVAGTTGSGKTETILTFLISLCALYTPEQVNLLLMDMKGAGFVQRIGEGENKLPHVVGTVTDISGDETGTGTAYMLKRFLHSMTAEVKRRKLYLSKMGVDSVDGYNSARSDLDKHLSTHPKLKREDIERLPALPHLFLVIDEFTELMRFSADNGDVDFKTAITSLARIGRSLGFHIILISQNIENAITPDIRVNSRARLCLKVATRDASKEMIGTDLAASPLMPGNGRAYLLVGTGSRFEYFQSGYSGADITRNLEAPIVITHAEVSGEYSLFYDSEEQNEKDLKAQDERKDSALEAALEEAESDLYEAVPEAAADDLCEASNMEAVDSESEIKKKTGITQLKALVDQIRVCDAYCREHGYWSEPHCVFQQPLPNACFYEFDWSDGTGEWKTLKTMTNKEEESDI